MAYQSKAGGTISYHNYEGNVGYSIYVPENVTADTPIFTYTYGGGGKADWYSGYHSNGNYGPFDALLEYGGDSIVIMPAMPWDADWGGNTNDIIEKVREEYGITNLSVSGGGFSKGGFGGFDVVVENIRRNPDIEPQVVFFIDDYSQKTYYCSNRLLTDEMKGLLQENETILFTFDPVWKSTDKYQPYIDAGLNVIRVEPKNYDHIAINSNFFKNGIYDYMAGGELPVEGYKYYRQVVTVDPETGESIVNWEEIDATLINTKEGLYNYLELEYVTSSRDNFFSKIFDFFGDKASILTNFGNNGHRLCTKPSEVAQVCNYLKSDVCAQLDAMKSEVDSAYQAVVEYAASSPYPVPVPGDFDKSAAIKAITGAIEACNDSARQVYNVSEAITRYSNGDWRISSNTFSQVSDFIGFVIGPSSDTNGTVSENIDNGFNDRFKFW